MHGRISVSAREAMHASPMGNVLRPTSLHTYAYTYTQVHTHALMCELLKLNFAWTEVRSILIRFDPARLGSSQFGCDC